MKCSEDGIWETALLARLEEQIALVERYHIPSPFSEGPAPNGRHEVTEKLSISPFKHKRGKMYAKVNLSKKERFYDKKT